MPRSPLRISFGTPSIQYNQVVPSDHLIDQDSPPVQMGFSPLKRLTVEVVRNKGPPTNLSEAFLKEEGLGLEDLERVVGREAAAAHTHPRHLHTNEPCVVLQKIPDAQIRATNKDPSPPLCILEPSRVFGPFVLIPVFNTHYLIKVAKGLAPDPA